MSLMLKFQRFRIIPKHGKNATISQMLEDSGKAKETIMVDRDLAADVHDAQEHLLGAANTISTDEVILLVEEIRGEPISGQERSQVAQLLSKHPDLVAAALGSGLWKRGINPGPPKRHFIGQGR